jgi:hypothetical protein
MLVFLLAVLSMLQIVVVVVIICSYFLPRILHLVNHIYNYRFILKWLKIWNNSNNIKIGKVYSVEYTDISKLLFSPYDIGHYSTNGMPLLHHKSLLHYMWFEVIVHHSIPVVGYLVPGGSRFCVAVTSGYAGCLPPHGKNVTESNGWTHNLFCAYARVSRTSINFLGRTY